MCPRSMSPRSKVLRRCVSWTMRPLDNVSLGQCVPWAMCPLDDVSLRGRPLDEAFLERSIPDRCVPTRAHIQALGYSQKLGLMRAPGVSCAHLTRPWTTPRMRMRSSLVVRESDCQCTQLQRSWVRSQHPSAQWNLRGGR